MNNNFGNLSLGAAEWKPPAPSSNVHKNRNNTGTGSSTSNTNSDLNAGQVKEFIPGQGWTVPPFSDQTGTTNADKVQIGR